MHSKSPQQSPRCRSSWFNRGVAAPTHLCFAHKAGRPGAQRERMTDDLPQKRSWPAGKRAAARGISRRRFLKAVGFSGAGMVGLSSYGLAIEPGYRLSVTRYRIAPRDWTPGLNLSVGVIADVHAGG